MYRISYIKSLKQLFELREVLKGLVIFNPHSVQSYMVTQLSGKSFQEDKKRYLVKAIVSAGIHQENIVKC